MFREEIVQTLFQIVHKLSALLNSPEFVARHRKSEKDFIRTRSLPFPKLIGFMLNLVNGSIQSELSRFFQILDNTPIALHSVSAAAFCKARKKFSYSAFRTGMGS